MESFLYFPSLKKSYLYSILCCSNTKLIKDCYSEYKENTILIEKIKITKKRLTEIDNALTGIVINILYQGQSTIFDVQVKNERIIKVFKQNEDHIPEEIINYDDEVNLYFYKEDAVLLEN